MVCCTQRQQLFEVSSQLLKLLPVFLLGGFLLKQMSIFSSLCDRVLMREPKKITSQNGFYKNINTVMGRAKVT